jgi:GNAT superfamily N-acetyltransferase
MQSSWSCCTSCCTFRVCGAAGGTFWLVKPHPLEVNLWAMQRDFARFPGTVVHDDPGLLWYSTPGTNSWLNGASRCELEDNAHEVITRVVAVWQGLGMAAMWHQTPSSEPEDLGDHLARHGFEPEKEPGMVLTLDRQLAAPPPELVISTVVDKAGVFEWVNTFDPAFGVEPRGESHPWLHAFTALYLGDSSPGRLFVGRVDGMTVATSLAFAGGGAVGVYGVGTVPDCRGRGYGGAMTVAAAEWGRELGMGTAVLAATEAGYPVYDRLGFRSVFETTAWIRPAEPATS